MKITGELFQISTVRMAPIEFIRKLWQRNSDNKPSGVNEPSADVRDQNEQHETSANEFVTNSTGDCHENRPRWINFDNNVNEADQRRSSISTVRMAPIEFIRELWNRFNHIPILGHMKALYHWVKGEKEEALAAFDAATRTSVVAAGGVFGVLFSEIAGPAIGGIVFGAAYDRFKSILSGDANDDPESWLEVFKKLLNDALIGMMAGALAGLLQNWLAQAPKLIANEPLRTVHILENSEVLNSTASLPSEVREAISSHAGTLDYIRHKITESFVTHFKG